MKSFVDARTVLLYERKCHNGLQLSVYIGTIIFIASLVEMFSF